MTGSRLAFRTPSSARSHPGLRRPPHLHWPTRPPGLHWPVRPPGLRWPVRQPAIPWPFALLDVAWVMFAIINLVAIVGFSHWETVPFHIIWISLTLLYGFRVWAIGPTLVVLAVVSVTTFAAIAYDVHIHAQSVDELNEVPLMAAMFWLMVWHSQRRLAADTERQLVSEENARLLSLQRRFLQDASHQLRTPITIALGHAELLAHELAGRREGRDVEVVVGELARLRRLGERLLVIAGSEDPQFLHPEAVALDRFTMEVLRKWMPTANRHWELGQLDPAMVTADRERLGLAVDALLENAVRHTGDKDTIKLSVLVHDGSPRMIVADTGSGIAPTELERIFDRFRTGLGSGGGRGTGLGLALVRAVAHAHGGDVLVSSTPGAGSEFALVFPALAGPTMPLTTTPGLAPGAERPDAGRTLLEDPWTSGTL